MIFKKSQLSSPDFNLSDFYLIRCLAYSLTLLCEKKHFFCSRAGVGCQENYKSFPDITYQIRLIIYTLILLTWAQAQRQTVGEERSVNTFLIWRLQKCLQGINSSSCYWSQVTSSGPQSQSVLLRMSKEVDIMVNAFVTSHSHLMQRADLEKVLMKRCLENSSLEKDPDAGKDWRQKEKGATEMRRLDSITDSMDMNLSKLWEMVKDREAWSATAHWGTESDTA